MHAYAYVADVSSNMFFSTMLWYTWIYFALFSRCSNFKMFTCRSLELEWGIWHVRIQRGFCKIYRKKIGYILQWLAMCRQICGNFWGPTTHDRKRKRMKHTHTHNTLKHYELVCVCIDNPYSKISVALHCAFHLFAWLLNSSAPLLPWIQLFMHKLNRYITSIEIAHVLYVDVYIYLFM